MKRTPRALLMAAAVSGLVSGAAIQQGHGDPTNAVAPGKVAPLKKVPKAHDCAGQNDCKALGGCKTEAHSCKFKNACKGKGGCELTAKDIKAWEKKQKEEAGKAAAKTDAKAPLKEPTKDPAKPVAPATP